MKALRPPSPSPPPPPSPPFSPLHPSFSRLLFAMWVISGFGNKVRCVGVEACEEWSCGGLVLDVGARVLLATVCVCCVGGWVWSCVDWSCL